MFNVTLSGENITYKTPQMRWRKINQFFFLGDFVDIIIISQTSFCKHPFLLLFKTTFFQILPLVNYIFFVIQLLELFYVYLLCRFPVVQRIFFIIKQQ